MQELLRQTREILKRDPRLAGLRVSADEGELHLLVGDDRFARLLPTDKQGVWRLEYFHNRERWESIDFRGTLRECVQFLSENTHYHFWEG
ncbi:hypothetical protein DESUT3_32020 [Desulfuromonas versatilis]|uniref:Uncharacterized protein n=1 Tax=Desulfuromonas versatilis TaxID=2802975 RepID=A0ABM8HZK8_9BACT|nr:hypothetical protein [Desulfuromonas versatilis]BCR06133.1 hypothetical protein DESUT3_32020 [Desulfuromonas versatilis]